MKEKTANSVEQLLKRPIHQWDYIKISNKDLSGNLSAMLNHMADESKGKSKIRIFSLDQCKIDKKDLELLEEVLSNTATLKDLTLKNIGFDVDIAKHVGTIITNNTNIKQVDLSYNNIDDKCLAAMPSQFVNVQNLNLSHNNICYKDFKNSDTDLNATNTLYLSHNNISDEGAKYIAAIMHSGSSYNLIDLSCNNIADAGIVVIAKSLRTNSLNISDNKITDVGAYDLANLINNNTTLSSMDITNNLLGKQGVQDLHDVWRILLSSYKSYGSSNYTYNYREYSTLKIENQPYNKNTIKKIEPKVKKYENYKIDSCIKQLAEHEVYKDSIVLRSYSFKNEERVSINTQVPELIKTLGKKTLVTIFDIGYSVGIIARLDVDILNLLYLDPMGKNWCNGNYHVANFAMQLLSTKKNSSIKHLEHQQTEDHSDTLPILVEDIMVILKKQFEKMQPEDLQDLLPKVGKGSADLIREKHYLQSKFYNDVKIGKLLELELKKSVSLRDIKENIMIIHLDMEKPPYGKIKESLESKVICTEKKGEPLIFAVELPTKSWAGIVAYPCVEKYNAKEKNSFKIMFFNPAGKSHRECGEELEELLNVIKSVQSDEFLVDLSEIAPTIFTDEKNKDYSSIFNIFNLVNMAIASLNEEVASKAIFPLKLHFHEILNNNNIDHTSLITSHELELSGYCKDVLDAQIFDT